jgi:hypothetical protein
VGDRILYLLHDPKPTLLKLLSGKAQRNLTAEKLPKVEEIPLTPAVSGTPIVPPEA